MSYSKTRADRFRKKMKEEGLDAFYLRNLSNIYWLTGFDGVFDGESAHAVLVTGTAIQLHTDSRYAQAMEDAAKDTDILINATAKAHSDWLADELKKNGSEGEGLADLASQNKERALAAFALGIEDDMALAEFRKLETALQECGQLSENQESGSQAIQLKETSGFGIGLRAVKDSEEVRRLRAAQAITDAAFAHIVAFIRPGMSEREVQIELEDYMIRHGASALAFPSIVATGPNAASPHAIPGSTKLEAGQAVVLDFGACTYGYCSDMTRTVFIGEPDARIRQAYAAIRSANEQVEALLKPGVTGAEAQKLAEDILAAAGFEGAMGHSLGHGVGIDVHEEPVLATRNKAPLEEGNVVTVEPGIYLSHEFGMRLEDFGIITHDGFEVFTQSSHDMVII